MIPQNFAYHAPASVEEALSLIEQYGDDCKILSGGQSLIPLLKLRLASPAAVIDIGRIKELNHITVEDGRLRIGSLATHAAIAASSTVRENCPLLADTAAQIGDQQVRNRGTLGGSLVHADPAADYPAAILALEAEIVVRGKGGERVIPAGDFFVDMLMSAVEPGEIVTEVIIPRPEQPSAASYQKVAQAASGFALVGVGVQLKVEGGVCREARIGVTGLAPKPFRATKAEQSLQGAKLDEATIRSAADAADAEASDALEDIHASGDYRRHLTRVYARRAIERAIA